MAFNQELKDFLAGWGATQKIFSGYDDSAYKKRRMRLLDAQTANTEQRTKDAADPDMRKLKIEGTRSLINSRNSQNAYRDWLRTYRPTQQDPQAPTAIPTPSNPYPQDQEVAPGQTSYLDEGVGDYEPTQFAQSGGPIEEALDNNARRQRERFGLPTKGYKQGGLVKAYDDGGMVEEDDEEDEDPGVSYAAAFDAAREGLGFAQAQAQAQPQAQPQAPQPRQAIPMQQPPAPRGMAQRQPRRPQGAPLEQVQQVEQAIDPKGKMSPAKRKMAALSTVYQFYLDKDPNRAKSAAASLLQHYEMAASRYSALAAVAAEKGDVNGALKAMVKAYENIPDGVEFKVTRAGDKFNYDFVDTESGKTFRRGVMTPDEILGAAMKMPQQGVAQFVARAAGRKLAGEKKPERRGEKATETETRTALVDAAAPENPDKPDKVLGHVRSLADSILQNNKLRPDDAVKMSRMLIDPTQSPTKTSAEGGAKYKFKGGPTVFVPDDVIERIAELRLEARGAGGESNVPDGQSRAADDELAKEPGMLSRAVGVVSDIAGRASKAMRDSDAERQPRAIAAEKSSRAGERNVMDTGSRAGRRRIHNTAERVEEARRDRQQQAVAANEEE